MAGNMQDNFDENGNPIRCSFCGKEQGQVRRLVKGPTNIFICDECVAACSEILEESLASDFMDAARNGKLPGFLNDHGQAASQPAVDPEAEGFELEDDARQVITHVPTPHEIYDELSAYVMGQEDAKRAMSVAVYNHYRRVSRAVLRFRPLTTVWTRSSTMIDGGGALPSPTFCARPHRYR